MITAHIAVTLASLIVFLAVPALQAAHAQTSRGFRAGMIRRSSINFTQAARDSRRRLEFLAFRSSSSANNSNSSTSENLKVPMRLEDGGGAYDMEFSMGTPPQTLTAIADTGSDLIWAKCGATCSSPSSSCTPPGTPSFDPSASSTFSKLPCSDGRCGFLRSNSAAQCGGAGGAECDYSYSYGDRSSAQGFLATETFTLGGGGAAARGVGFGCTTASEGFKGDGSGIVGLGRGPLSLVSQLDVSAFMYCLTMDASKTSALLFGSLANLTNASNVQSTGLLAEATYYKVSLRNITIGSAAAIGGPGAGVVFDSGTTLTYLADPAYSAALEAFVSQLSSRRFVPVDLSQYGFDACYWKPSDGRPLDEGVPTMALHFDGGADMALPLPNYFMEHQGVVCWIVQRSPDPRVSIIGNIMQQNYLVLHDLRRSVLSFQPASCDTYQQGGSGSRSPPPFLYQFCTMLLCFYIYMYTSMF